MSDQPKLVFNIESATPSMVRAMDLHERLRAPDGTSAIDPLRKHLNEVLVGLEDGPSRSLDAFYATGIKRPTAQAEAPYVRIVISASPGYFRPDNPEAAGTWDEDRMRAWRDRSLAWLKAEFGGDLVYASLHLDEDTPHVHALVAPTYQRKARKPGRMKRNETPEEFVARVAEAQAADGVRTVGRASHPTLKLKGSFSLLRKSLALAVADLGIEYGEDRDPGAPPGLSTREWVRQEAARLRCEAAAQAQTRAQIDQDAKELAQGQENLKRDRAEFEVEKAQERAQLDGEWYEVGVEKAANAADRRKLSRELKTVEAMKAKLLDLGRRVVMWLRRPDLPTEARQDGRALIAEARVVLAPQEAQKAVEQAGPGFR